ncbi:MAG: ribokinase [Lachnospiraceae bacterium]
MSKIAVIGSYAIGMTIQCEHFPIAGETVPGHGFEVKHGGKGSNQAVAVARLGGDVLYAGCVGEDSFGDMCVSLHEQEQIDPSFIKRSRTGQSTGVGLIYVSESGENEIVIDFAANNEVSKSDIDELIPHLKECRLLLMQLEISMDTVAYAAKKCKEIGIDFVLNPAPFSTLEPGLLEYCSYLIPNQTEARLLLGMETDDSIEDEEVARQILEKGAKNVIMTLGGEGALIANESGVKRIAGQKVEVVDTTGAGDTFCAAFCVALSRDKSEQEAVRFANAAAGLAVTKYGVIESIPTLAEVENFAGQLERN